MQKLISAIFFICLPLLGLADEQPLPADRVFSFSAHTAPEQIVLQWKIAKGYYLYRDRISIELTQPTQQKLGDLQLPKGLVKHNNILGNFLVYEDTVTVNTPLANAEPYTLVVHYQGCAKNGFCYPPQTRFVTFSKGQLDITNPDQPTSSNQLDSITHLLKSQNYVWTLLGFLGFGLLLAFTPCVFPMIPILSGIIVGHGQKITTYKALLLSLTYVLAMAITYALAGLGAAYAGNSLQVILQAPWAIVLFSTVFVLLAFSLFGFYELQLPAGLQTKLLRLSHKQQGGHYLGVAVMGCLSTLIVSPCVSAPLAGALGYIGQTGDAILGATALFCMGIGMGLPLLVVGTSAGKLLPKAGPWLVLIKQVFGILLIAVAIWLLSRITPSWASSLLWASLCIGCAIYLKVFYARYLSRWHWLGRVLSVLFLCLGILLVANVGRTRTQTELTFQPINSLAELNQSLVRAKAVKTPVMLDFYADWCIACKDLEKNVLINPVVKKQLQNFILLRVDMTKLNQNHKQLMQTLNVIAPPTFIFFKDGNELKQQRIVGELNTNAFNKHLQAIADS